MSELRPTSPVPPAASQPASIISPNFGTDKAPSESVKGMPYNYGEGLLPHVVTFQGIISSVSRVYRYYDEAMKASAENARFMRNDLMIMEPVEQRRRTCALLNWHLEVDDPDNATEKKLAENLTKLLRATPNFLKFREVLLDAVWFGKNAVQFAWKWKKCRGVDPVGDMGLNMTIDHWRPIHGDKVVFRYDDGTREYDPNQIGIRVGAGYTAGDKGIQGRLSASGRRKVEPTDYGLAYFLEPWERRMLAIHKHMIEDGEYEDPQSAGKIHGLGIRSRIYWTWYMKQEAFAYLLEMLERSGAGGVEIWYYPWGNPDAKAQVEQCAKERIGNARNIILMPRPQGEDAQAFGVEIVPANTAGIEVLKTLIDEYFGNQIMRYVLGQTATNKPQASGLGSDLPQIQLGSYLQIIKYDAINLGETMTTDVVDVLKELNYPHLNDIPCRFVIDTESEDVQSKLTAWKSAYDCGVKTKASDWLKMIGASKPEEDDEIIQNPVTQQQDRLYQQFMSHKQDAEAMGMTPEGTPQPGEEQQPGMEQEMGGLGEEAAEPDPDEIMGAGPEGPQQFSLQAHDSPQGGPYMDKQPDPKPEKYLMADGSRKADAGIAEGKLEKDWQINSTRAGGSGGVEQGRSSPAGPLDKYAKEKEVGAMRMAELIHKSIPDSLDPMALAKRAAELEKEAAESTLKRLHQNDRYAMKSAAGQKGLWEEDKHPRADDGKFGSGGGGKAEEAQPGKKPEPTRDDDADFLNQLDFEDYVKPIGFGNDGNATFLKKPLPINRATGDASVDAFDSLPKVIQNWLLEYSKGNATRFGGDGNEAELKLVPRDSLTPSQSGEDYLNDSSRDSARAIKEGLSDKWLRLEDLAPIVSRDGKILDGNHRHCAAGLNNQEMVYTLALKPEPAAKSKPTGEKSGNNRSETDKEYSKTVWDAVQKKLDAGESVTIATQMHAWKIAPKNRSALRMHNGEIQIVRGKHWDTIAFGTLDQLGHQVDLNRKDVPLTQDEIDEDEQRIRKAEQDEVENAAQEERHTAIAAKHFGGDEQKASDSFFAAEDKGTSYDDWAKGLEKPQRHASSFADHVLARYFKASDPDKVERFWAGDEREIVTIVDGVPIRYSRKQGSISCEYIKE